MDRDMPRANSALSSKTEFDQAGPKPSQFVVYGMLGIAEPQAWVQPVALATIMRGPKSWVRIFM